MIIDILKNICYIKTVIITNIKNSQKTNKVYYTTAKADNERRKIYGKVCM